MGNFGQILDVNDIPEQSFEPLPAGWYSAMITKGDVVKTKDGNGERANFEWTIIGPTHQGAVVFDSANLKNPSDKATEIGRQQLGSIMRAIGVTRAQDTSELVNGTCQIKLVVKPEEGQYKARNEVKGYKALEGSAPPKPFAKTAPPAFAKPVPTAPAPTSEAPVAKVPSWMPKK